jgi:hypothetical protein
VTLGCRAQSAAKGKNFVMDFTLQFAFRRALGQNLPQQVSPPAVGTRPRNALHQIILWQ